MSAGHNIEAATAEKIAGWLEDMAEQSEKVTGGLVGYGVIRPPASCYRYAAERILRGDWRDAMLARAKLGKGALDG